MNQKGISLIIIILVIAGVLVVVGGGIFVYTYWWLPHGGGKSCVNDSDCIVFGKSGDCNCGCFNKDLQWWLRGGDCYCAAPPSCKCENNKCKGIFDQTADWKTYRNEEYGFEVKYPKELILDEVLANGRNYTRLWTTEMYENYKNNKTFSGPYIFIITDSLNGGTLDSWIENEYKNVYRDISTSCGKESVSYGEVKFTKICINGYSGDYRFHIANKNSVVTIAPLPRTAINDPVFQKILSTFKFISQ